MKQVGILYHPQRSDSLQLAQEVCLVLRQHRIDIWQGSADDEEALRRAASELDLLVTLGGDGTIVRAVRVLATAGVPVLGVNLGRLGFLAEVEPEEVLRVIPALLDGRYRVEQRMMLRTELWREGRTLLQAEAINDVVMARGRISRVVRISVEVDGHYVMTQTADGMIVSTPTGTTAYCLAAGGPIVAPDLNCMTITPVAPHLSLTRAIVIPPHRRLRLQLIKGQDAMLTIDGQLDAELVPGDEVYYTASEHTAKFVRFGDDGHFYESVLRRLRWPDRGPIP